MKLYLKVQSSVETRRGLQGAEETSAHSPSYIASVQSSKGNQESGVDAMEPLPR